MNNLIEVLKNLAFAVGGGGATWLFAKLKTPREKKAADLELIEKAITPLLNSIRELTNHNSETTAQLIAEQAKSLKLLQENAALLQDKVNLVQKVESLERKVQKLTAMVEKLAKNEKDNNLSNN